MNNDLLKLNNKVILITGSAGFIGFHLSKKLLETGVSIIGLDNFNNYYDSSLKEARNKILEEFPNFKLYRGDLADLEFVKNVFKDNKIDKVCNLAAQAGVRYSMTNPDAYIQSNLLGFANITGQAARMGFVYLLQFTALLSLNLAVINILPLPALDGGRILFLLIEKLKGKPVRRNIETIVHNIGFMLLIALIIFITYKDVIKLF